MSSILIAKYNDALRSTRAADNYVAERAAAAADRSRADHGPEADAALAEARAWRADAEVRLVRAREALIEPEERPIREQKKRPIREQKKRDATARTVAAAVEITDLLWQQVRAERNARGDGLRLSDAWRAAMEWKDRLQENLDIDEQSLRAARERLSRAEHEDRDGMS